MDSTKCDFDVIRGRIISVLDWVGKRGTERENLATRLALVPVLQAEEDRRYVGEKKKAIEFERDLMKDMKGEIHHLT